MRRFGRPARSVPVLAGLAPILALLIITTAALGFFVVNNPARADVRGDLLKCIGGGYPYYHWYARAVSGAGNTVEGTGADTTTPTSWSVDRSASAASIESVWITNNNNGQNATEVGFYSGWNPYYAHWTNGLLPYLTLHNGSYGYWWGSQAYIPAGLNINMGAMDGDQISWVYAYYVKTNYYIGKPALNHSQGEVTQSSRTWMGGGSGETFYGAWTEGGPWYRWGFHNDCANSPYWIQWWGPYTWRNGGYGP